MLHLLLVHIISSFCSLPVLFAFCHFLVSVVAPCHETVRCVGSRPRAAAVALTDRLRCDTNSNRHQVDGVPDHVYKSFIFLAKNKRDG